MSLGCNVTDVPEEVNITQVRLELAEKFDRDDRTVLTAIIIDSILFCAIAFVYFCLHKKYRPFFFENPFFRGRGPTPPEGAFGWVSLVIRMPDEEFEKHAGLDALVMRIFIRTILGIFLRFSLTMGFMEVCVYIGCSFGVGENFFPAGVTARFSLSNFPRVSEEDSCTYPVLALSLIGMCAVCTRHVSNAHRHRVSNELASLCFSRPIAFSLVTHPLLTSGSYSHYSLCGGSVVAGRKCSPPAVGS